MEIYDDDSNMSNPDWSKMASKALKEGYKEGISSTRESLFQQGFDDGFKLGLSTGFSLGILQGISSRSLSNTQQADSNELKNIAVKGNCKMCVDKDLMELESVKQVISIQNNANEIILKDTQDKYAEILVQMGLKDKLMF